MAKECNFVFFKALFEHMKINVCVTRRYNFLIKIYEKVEIYFEFLKFFCSKIIGSLLSFARLVCLHQRLKERKKTSVKTVEEESLIKKRHMKTERVEEILIKNKRTIGKQKGTREHEKV